MAQDERDLVQSMSELLDDERVLAGSAVQRAYDCDAYTIDRSPPACVVLPVDTQEVQRVVQWCTANRVPYTPRGAGTGLSGGALPAMGGILISTKRMNKILEIDVENRCLKAQAGAVNLHLSRAVAEYGLHFAPDPSSQTVCTIGGNIAENSGGPHTLKHGVTSQHILEVTLVDAEGEVVSIGSRVRDTPGLDLLALVVGSEGTLGVVTEAWVRLVPVPASIETALASFPSVRAATESVAAIISRGIIPAALEMIDRNCLVAVQAAFHLDVPKDTEALLLIECDGESDVTTKEISAVRELCLEFGAIEVQIAATEADRQRLWTARKKGIGAMGRLAPTIITHDGVIPRSKLPEMLEFIYDVAAQHGLGVGNMFHAGDGNLHPIFYFDDRIPGTVDAVVAAGEQVIRKCIELGGSASGEHGIGVEKAELLRLMFNDDDMGLQRDARAIFNPGELCNPCKIIPDQKGCVEHMRRWRGAAT
ncbi:MAG: FAD-binding protein [Armatimonadetes bacterium]|nr:FAD-binding protein [Armatimonadota bacterium]